MNAPLDFYQSQAKKNRSTLPWLAALQEKALDKFCRFGFPTRHDEEWKYTLLETFFKQNFTQAEETANPLLIPNLPEWLKPQATIYNGQTQVLEHPKSIIIKPLVEAFVTHADILEKYLGKSPLQHAFSALNMANLQSGLFIYLPKGVQLENPLVINHWQDGENQAVYSRQFIIAEEGSEATMIETFNGKPACSYFTNTITEIYAAKNARLKHYKIQQESLEAFHIGQVAIQQAKNSQVDSFSLSLGGKLVRSDTSFKLQEEQASCSLNGIYMTKEGQHIDHHTVVHHLVPDCRSEQNYKGILMGKSRAVFNGKVVVAKDAQHTQAYQQNKNLLLSEGAEIDTKPQLEIFADDVICTHGATVGQLDEEALFYLATRGIGLQEAKRYLVQAFASENIKLVSLEKLAEWMVNLINQNLE